MSLGARIAWFCLNLKSGGTRVDPCDPLLRRHGSVEMKWLRLLPDIVRLSPACPDVIFLQEAKWFDLYGDELLLYVERRLRQEGLLPSYRAFLTRSLRSHHHQVVFINTDRVQAVHHWRGGDPDESRGMYGFVEVIVDGDENRPVWLKSIHLDPRDGDSRYAEAKQIHAAVPLGQRAVIAGDFNSITSCRTAEQGEPQRDFSAMPLERRYHKGIWPPTKPNGDTDPDTHALDYLLGVGWRDQHIADHNTTPTVAPGHDRGGELIIDRCLTYGALVTVPGSVWVDTSHTPYSDHRALGGAITITDQTEQHQP